MTINLAAARGAVETAYGNLAGAEVPLAAKLVSTELVNGRAAPYALATSAEVVRLGALYLFAMYAVLTAKSVATGLFGAILSDTKADYLDTRFGPKGFSAEQFLAKFGMAIVTGTELMAAIHNIDDYVSTRFRRGGLGVVVATPLEFRGTLGRCFSPNARSIVKDVFHLPVIQDDGTTLTPKELSAYVN
jgi:hypothetical protein